jgi:hypothetical protein
MSGKSIRQRPELPISSLDQRRFHEGRGQGELASYTPWVLNHDESSNGFSTRIQGMVTGRDHHFQTDGHTDFFRILDVCPQIVDIKESFPLLLDRTVSIAKECNIPHPHHSSTGEYRVMTTDFFITARRGLTVRHFGRCYMKSSALSSAALHTLEIERRYWSLRQIDWGIVTEKEITATQIANAKFLHGGHSRGICADYDGTGVQSLPDVTISRITAVLTPSVLEGQLSLNVITQQCDEMMGLKPGISLLVAKHLLLKCQWPIDFRRPIQPWIPLPLR